MSRLPFELALAFRYLRPKGSAISIITLLCIIGVTLGVAILIIVIAVMTGFAEEMRSKALGFNTHMKVLRVSSTMNGWKGVAEQVAQVPGISGVAPFVMGQVLIKTQPRNPKTSPQAVGVLIRGIDTALESKVSDLPERVVAGKFDLRNDGIVVGIEVARNLSLSLGDKVAVASIQDLVSMERSRERGVEQVRAPGNYYVRGIFSVGHAEYDSTIILMSLSNAQDLYGLEDQVHGLLVKLPSMSEKYTQDKALEIEKRLGTEFETRTWMDENQHILGAIAMEKKMMFFLLFFIMIVAAFCIICAQLAFVMQKTREIGVLKSLGASTWEVVRLFLVQSFSVGCMGVLLGLVTGRLALKYRNEFLELMRRVTGQELFPSDIYMLNSLPAKIESQDLWVICGVSLLIALLAGSVPAWVAARLRPVEALRHE